LIIAVRRLGRDRVLYQPILLRGSPPSDEEAAAALFAHAAEQPEPIPEVDFMPECAPSPADSHQ
jgi:hypothetical protein